MNHFNKSMWMRRINPELLYRFWLYKDTDKPLVLNKNGAKITYIKTSYGVFSFIK